MRAGAGLGMVLHAEHRVGLVAQAGQRLVVQVGVRALHIRRQDSGSTLKLWFCAVISTLPVAVVHDRVVAAVVAELELVGLAAQREAEDLVAEADAEDRLLALAACCTVSMA